MCCRVQRVTVTSVKYSAQCAAHCASLPPPSIQPPLSSYTQVSDHFRAFSPDLKVPNIEQTVFLEEYQVLDTHCHGRCLQCRCWCWRPGSVGAAVGGGWRWYHGSAPRGAAAGLGGSGRCCWPQYKSHVASKWSH